MSDDCGIPSRATRSPSGFLSVLCVSAVKEYFDQRFRLRLKFSKSIRPSSRRPTTFAVRTTLADWIEAFKLAARTVLVQMREPARAKARTPNRRVARGVRELAPALLTRGLPRGVWRWRAADTPPWPPHDCRVGGRGFQPRQKDAARSAFRCAVVLAACSRVGSSIARSSPKSARLKGGRYERKPSRPRTVAASGRDILRSRCSAQDDHPCQMQNRRSFSRLKPKASTSG